jgi:hypothetical protein
VFPIVGSNCFWSVDLGLRGAAVGLCLLIAGLLLRDRRDSTVAELGAALAVSAAASAICSAPGLPRPWAGWSPGAPVVFWLWARAAFDDDFVLRRWHGVLWAAVVGMQLVVAGWPVQSPTLDRALDRGLQATYLAVALLAAAQTRGTWRADLVEARRRLRLVVVIGTTAWIALTAFLNFSRRHRLPVRRWQVLPAPSVSAS